MSNKVAIRTFFTFSNPAARASRPTPPYLHKGELHVHFALMTTDANAVMSSCHHVIMPLRKKACWEAKEIVYIILILYILFL